MVFRLRIDFLLDGLRFLKSLISNQTNDRRKFDCYVLVVWQLHNHWRDFDQKICARVRERQLSVIWEKTGDVSNQPWRSSSELQPIASWCDAVGEYTDDPTCTRNGLAQPFKTQHFLDLCRWIVNCTLCIWQASWLRHQHVKHSWPQQDKSSKNIPQERYAATNSSVSKPRDSAMERATIPNRCRYL